MFGELRASDPQEPETSELYAEECIEMTELEPPWMRRTTRCMIQTKTDEDRALCFTAAMDDDASPSGRLEQLERRQRELEQERVRLEREQRELQLEIEHERQRLLVEEEEP